MVNGSSSTTFQRNSNNQLYVNVSNNHCVTFHQEVGGIYDCGMNLINEDGAVFKLICACTGKGTQLYINIEVHLVQFLLFLV